MNPKYYFREEIDSHKLRIIPVGGASEVYKIYNHLSISFSDLKDQIKGKVVLLMDTDEELFHGDSKSSTHLWCKRIVNDNSQQQTKLVDIRSNPVSPKTEIEDALNGKIFFESLKCFKDKYPEYLSFVDVKDSKKELPSYYALDLNISQYNLLTKFFDDVPTNKVDFAQKYLELVQEQESSTPLWIQEIKDFYNS